MQVAINLLSGKEYEALEPDKYIYRVALCDYWADIDGKSLMLFETNEPVEKGHEYRHYRIGDKIYHGIWTNSHDELVNMGRKKIEQIKLF